MCSFSIIKILDDNPTHFRAEYFDKRINLLIIEAITTKFMKKIIRSSLELDSIGQN